MQRALSFRFSRPSPPLLSLSARPAARAVTAVRAYKGEDAVKGAASKVRRRDEGKREEGRKRKASRGRGGTPSFSQPPSPPLLLPSSQAKSAIASVGSDDVQDKLAALGQDIKAAWAKTDDKPAVVVLGGAALVALVAANAVVVTFVAPHSLDGRPLILGRGHEVRIVSRTRDVGSRVVVDGHAQAHLGKGETAVIRMAPETARLAILPDRPFLSRYRDKFGH